MDESYFRAARRSWHALDEDRSDLDDGSAVAFCGYTTGEIVEIEDRIPSEGHLCGRCGRSIAAKADVES